MLTSAPHPPAGRPGAVEAGALLLTVQEVLWLAAEGHSYPVQVIVAWWVLQHAVILPQRPTADPCEW